MVVVTEDMTATSSGTGLWGLCNRIFSSEVKKIEDLVAEGERSELKRTLGVWELTAVGIGGEYCSGRVKDATAIIYHLVLEYNTHIHNWLFCFASSNNIKALLGAVSLC